MLKGDSTRLMGAKHLVLAVAVVALGVLGVAAPASASASPSHEQQEVVALDPYVAVAEATCRNGGGYPLNGICFGGRWDGAIIIV